MARSAKVELQDILQDLEAAPRDALKIVDLFRRRLDLKYLAYAAVTFPKPKGSDLPIYASNYPQEWVQHYIDNNYINKDPVVLHAIRDISPVDWVGIDKKTGLNKRIFGEAREFGITETGLSIAVRSFRGEVAVLTVCGDFSPKTWEDY